MSSRLRISRDHTFWYRGEMYQACRMGPYGSGDSVWEVWRDSDLAYTGTFDTLDEIRDLAAEGDRNDWPDLIEEVPER